MSLFRTRARSWTKVELQAVAYPSLHQRYPTHVLEKKEMLRLDSRVKEQEDKVKVKLAGHNSSRTSGHFSIFSGILLTENN